MQDIRTHMHNQHLVLKRSCVKLPTSQSKMIHYNVLSCFTYNFFYFTIVGIKSAVVWSCLPFIRSGQNHLARHRERVKKTRQTEKEVGRQHQGTDRPGVRQVPEGSGEQEKREETGCQIICGAPTTLEAKG